MLNVADVLTLISHLVFTQSFVFIFILLFNIKFIHGFIITDVLYVWVILFYVQLSSVVQIIILAVDIVHCGLACYDVNRYILVSKLS